MTIEIEAPARRFLHICYCCASTDQVVNFFVDGLDMKEVMRNPIHPSDGSLLGIEGEIISGAAFVYDKRGPRTSSSLEVQEWVSPQVTGTPLSDASRVGMQAVGFALPDLAATIQRLQKMGAKIISRAPAPWATDWVTIADSNGTLIDLFEDTAVPHGESRLRHLRSTVTDLEVSLPWYYGMGFIDVASHDLESGEFVNLQGPQGTPAQGRAHRLKLPDEMCELVLVEWTNPASHGQHPVDANHAGWFRTAVSVDDTVASYNRFLADGWTFARQPRQVELSGTAVPDMWICFLNDPDGIPFEFVQRPRSAFRPERRATES